LDEETGIPWQVPEALVKYKAVDYLAAVQPYSRRLRCCEESPVSPKHYKFMQDSPTKSAKDDMINVPVQMLPDMSSETSTQPVAETDVNIVENKGNGASLSEEPEWSMFLSIPEET